MEKPGIYTVRVTLPVRAPFEFEFMTFDYVLWARNDKEYFEESEMLKKSLKPATVTLLKRDLKLLRKTSKE